MIEYFEFILEPVHYDRENHLRRARIKIKTSRQPQFNLDHVLRCDDFKSYYDQIFDELKTRLREHIDKDLKKSGS